MWRNDKYVEPVKYPAGLGYEAAGTVDAVGKDVTGIAVGDDVNVIPAFSQNQYFAYGEVILVPDYAFVKHPKSLSLQSPAFRAVPGRRHHAKISRLRSRRRETDLA